MIACACAKPKLVVIESPYAGDVEANVAFARACMFASFDRGEYPLASHLLYTQPGILHDHVQSERALGIRAGLAWAVHADATAVYTDRGMSNGMLVGIRAALDAGRPVFIRNLAQGTNELASHKRGCPATPRPISATLGSRLFPSDVFESTHRDPADGC